MIEWLRRRADEVPQIDLADRTLPLVIRRLAQSRRMTLRLSPDGSEVRVSMPRWGRTAEALAFARARTAWIAGQLARLPQRRSVEPGSTLPYRGQALTVRHDPNARRRPLLEEEAIVLGGPEPGLSSRLQRWLEAEARVLFAADLADYCRRAGVAVPKLALSRAERRWGSCSTGSATTGPVIRMNWRLVMASDAVRRSVVAHEVAHLIHFDHSPRFHALLGMLFEGDLDAANRWLKAHGRTLYTRFG